MAQYCKYCSFCVYGDTAYCTDHKQVLSDAQIQQVNYCKDFDLSPLGDVRSGKQYVPRKRRRVKQDNTDQLTFIWN